MAAVVADDYSDPPSPSPRLNEEARLLPSSSMPGSARPSRAVSTASFVSSPLNPSPASPPPHVTNPFSSSRSRPGSRTSHVELAHAHHRDTTYSTLGPPPSSFGLGSHRGSMLLYRLASDDDNIPPTSASSLRDSQLLLPPPKFPGGQNRDSTISSSGSSFISLDSKYPLSNRDSAFPTAPRGLVPYEYDPALDELEPPDEEDLLHDPAARGHRKTRFPWRGLLNVAVLLLLVLGLLCLFVFYPVLTFYRNEARNAKIDGNIRINATGQAPVLFQMPDLIDLDTPDSAKTRTGYDGFQYDLVFSDEFNAEGRTFYPGDDPYWEAVDLWYGATGDIEWYDPSQVTTRNGSLVITMDSVDTLVAGLTPGESALIPLYLPFLPASTELTALPAGSTAPFTAAENHNLQYRSGMLQSWNKFCFTSGYIEVAVVLPGPNEDARGYVGLGWAEGTRRDPLRLRRPFSMSFAPSPLRPLHISLTAPSLPPSTQWPGAWTMGNLARPGYPATTDGMWPYTYNECDVGTFPNQTNKDKLGPPAALHSDESRSRYNYELSWLSGQRASACSCPGSDHPGPTVSRGRGAPEIDILEAERDKDEPNGHVVSQSAQFAPFTHDYLYGNESADQWAIFSPNVTRANKYRGSAVQQAVSGIVKLPSDMFQGTGQRFAKLGASEPLLPLLSPLLTPPGSPPSPSFSSAYSPPPPRAGFEYWANPKNVQEGYITWQVDGVQSHRVGAGAVGPDQGVGGSGVGQRLIPEEPMSVILNLGMSPNWQTIDVSTLMFPAEFLVDYVRVYQRKGAMNIGCSPKEYPTEEYINNHEDAYQNVNTTTWNWERPKNRLVRHPLPPSPPPSFWTEG
ncbi:hypothetical protein D9615_009226 [Tricholomella constricta]|uniref:GH16 domain-containing protein n=1 Tax=Tricholomella constricta TaxID=117010 RepID=A0A8H5GWF0_9AGAR|nr:hypothetical protein D9615_009226 [Tricholomella constricta]